MKRVSVPSVCVGDVWKCLRLWTGVISFILFSGCALANSQRGFVVDETVGGKAAWDRQAIVDQRDAYYHAILSYAYQLRNQIPEHLAKATAEVKEALQYRPQTAYLHAELARLQLRQGELEAARRGTELHCSCP